MFDATPFLRLYARRRKSQLNAMDLSSVQEGQLLRLVAKAKDTLFGKQHGFERIRSVAEFQAQVPLRTYENFWDDYFKNKFPCLDHVTWPGRIPFFAVSSGTSSGKTKYLPLSKEMIRSNVKAGTDLLSHHVNYRPHSKLFGGKSFVLGGSTDLVEEAPGIWSGDLSGIAVKTLPWWAAQRYFPEPELALLKNWEEKIELLSRRSLREDIRMISGVPSWMLLFLNRVWDLKPESRGQIGGAYPNLEMIVHGGVNFAPYRKQFDEMLRGSHAELREVYPASEGFIAVQDLSPEEGMRVVPDHGIFFEFVPVGDLKSENPRRLWAKNVEVGAEYAIVMSTCAGLWSYVIGDTVKVVERSPLRLFVTGRTAYYLSAFGEHLTADELDDGVSFAAEQSGMTVTDYSAGPLFPRTPAELGGHLIVIETAEPVPANSMKQVAERFSVLIDQRLCGRNDDYEAHRAKGFGLNRPVVHLVAPGTFTGWMKSRGKLGGQNKVPRIITNLELLENLSQFSRFERP
jgi:hypothetical protein